MFRFDEGLKVYLLREPIDFRLNINGLALLVEKALPSCRCWITCCCGMKNWARWP